MVMVQNKINLNERKQTNRNVEQDRDSGSTHTSDDKGTREPKRPLDWDARDIETYSWVRGRSGKYENRFFEQNED